MAARRRRKAEPTPPTPEPAPRPATTPAVDTHGPDVDRHVLAATIGVDVSSIRLFVQEGMPRTARGSYPLAACVQWYIKREVDAARASRPLNDLDQSRRQKLELETRRAAVELAQLEGRLLPAELVEQRLRDRLDDVAGSIKALGRYQSRVKAAITDADADELLDQIIDELLEELHGQAETIN